MYTSTLPHFTFIVAGDRMGLYDGNNQQPYDNHTPISSNWSSLSSSSTSSPNDNVLSRDSLNDDADTSGTNKLGVVSNSGTTNLQYGIFARRLRSGCGLWMATFGIPPLVSVFHFLAHMCATASWTKTGNVLAAIALIFLSSHRLHAIIGLCTKFKQNWKQYNTALKTIMLMWIFEHSAIFILEVVLIFYYWLDFLQRQHILMFMSWALVVIIWLQNYFCVLAAVYNKLSHQTAANASKFVLTVGMNMWCIFAPVVYFVFWAVVLELSDLDSDFEQSHNHMRLGVTLSTTIWFPILISV